MKDKDKTKEQLINPQNAGSELAKMRQRIAELTERPHLREAVEAGLRQAEAALRESEERFGRLSEATFEGIAITEQGKVVEVNDQLTKMLGYKSSEIIGMSAMDFVAPESRDLVLKNIMSGHETPYEHLALRKDGSTFPVEVQAKTLPYEGRKVRVTAIRDITDHKQTEEALRQRNRELALLTRAGQTFSSTLDLDQVLATVLEEVRRLMDGIASSIWLVDPETDELVCRQATGPGNEIVRGWRLAPGKGIAGWVVRHGESQIIPDMRADERHFKGVDQQIGLALRSFLSVPLQVKQEVIGVLQVMDTKVGRFSPGNLALLEPLAASAAIAIENARLYEQAQQKLAERKRTEEELQNSQALLNETGRTAKVGGWEINMASQELTWTDEVYHIHEVDLDYVPTVAKAIDFYAPKSRPIIAQAVQGAIDNEAPFDLELQLITAKGNPIWVHAIGRAFRRDGKTIKVSGTFQDITERKQAEEEIRRRNRELTLLNRVIAASTADTERETVLEIACRELALTFDLPRATAALLNEGKTEAVVVAEHRAEGRPPIPNETIPVAGDSSFQHLLDAKTPLVVEDAQNDPRLAMAYDLTRSEQRGTVSLLLLPLVVEGEVRGSLSLASAEARQFSTEEVNLAWNVASQVAGVLARIRLDEKRQQLEAQYHQAQKMEAVGRLAGGVAHDFNNLLTAIMGYTGLTLEALSPDDPVRSDIEGIQKTAERAAGLTRQLLAFARRQIIRPTVLNLNDLILNIDNMLRRLIDENIELVTLPAPDLGRVKADPGQLEQILLNLAVNARDAMPNGGNLTIETANITLDEDYAGHHLGVPAGDYILLTVSDTGLGMTEEVKAHLFEPFFTTKEVDEGTGLGLAICFGIVKQSGGHIQVYSEVNRGTTFKIYLPRLREAVSPVSQDNPNNLPRGIETILLVEDEASVRELASRMLRQQGYNVLEAANGDEALRAVRGEQREAEIHLLLTDVVMPRLGGRELADQVKTMRPDLKVLFISGYTGNAVVHHGLLEPGMAFLSKPFSPKMLAHKVREVLDS